MNTTMYPQACLERIQDAETVTEGVAACEDLQNWLRCGGFEPKWSEFPKGTAAFVRWRKRQNILNPAICATE